MKKLTLVLTLLATVLTLATTVQAADSGTPPKPTTDDRLADLEAYVLNGARQTNAATALATAPGPGHNGWMMTSAALVLFMTLPGLALFYGGLVRRKNVLSVLAQCFGITGLVAILWWLFGYSFVFAGGDGAGAWLGDFKKYALLNGVDSTPNTDYAAWVSHNVFSMYQMMFAIITPALIIGAIAERMKFSAILLFMALWMVVVYFPLAHWIWGVTGAMNGVWNANASIKAIDFAGGTVVHMSSGWSALILCMILGKRLGFGRQSMAPHSMVLCMVGTGMLWVGWYGFNAGSAGAADGVAANAFLTTTMATAVASFVWPMVEWMVKGKPSILGFCSGAVAGLVVITPACGFVTVGGAVLIGICAGIVPFLACAYLKGKIGYDDALDTFGVHAVGGTMGAFLTGCLARNSANANLATNLKDYVKDSFSQPLVFEQVKAILITIILAVVGTTIIAYVVKAVVGLRPSEEVETLGLDLAEHGEEGYHSA